MKKSDSESAPKAASRRPRPSATEDEPEAPQASLPIAEPATSTALADEPAAPTSRKKREPHRFRSIHVDPSKVEHTALPETSRFWVGAFADAPFDCKHAGGVTFQKYSGVIESDPKTGQLILDRAFPGNVVDLSADQVELVQKNVARKVIRVIGRREDATGNYRCDSYDVSVTGYRPSNGDRCMGEFIYMVEMDEKMPPNWRSSKPPAMYSPDDAE